MTKGANMRYVTELRLDVQTELSDDDFDAHTDKLFDELMTLDNVIDPDMTLSLTQHSVVITVASEAETTESAAVMAFSAVRTAIHAAGGGTPGWEDALDLAIAKTAPIDESADDDADVRVSI